jgi:hypothetical protein
MAAAFLTYSSNTLDDSRLFKELLHIVSEILDLYRAGKPIMFSNVIYNINEGIYLSMNLNLFLIIFLSI